MLVETKLIDSYSDYASFINDNEAVVEWLKEKHKLDWNKLVKSGKGFNVVENFGSDEELIKAYYNDLPGNYLVQYLEDSNDDFDTIEVLEVEIKKPVIDVIDTAVNKAINSLSELSQEPLDGDETKAISNLFLLELDLRNGNITDEEYDKKKAKATSRLNSLN